MDVEKSLIVAAPIQRLWDFLLDPKTMAACVPGMQSIEVVSDTEYLATVQVKLAFISARFKVRTVVTEKTAPAYLRSESTGEDATVSSSLKSVSEMFLTAVDPAHTELKVKVKAEVMGRLGTFGLNAMKTKADRMWDEFGQKLAAQIAPQAVPAQASYAPPAPSVAATDAEAKAATPVDTAAEDIPAPAGFLARWRQRLCGGADVIRIEIRRTDATIVVHWPGHRAAECSAWLQRQVDGTP